MEPIVKVLMLKGEKGDPGGSTWGNISGNLSSQTDLKTQLDNKVNSSSIGTAAFSNDYNDLNNKPTIPTKISDLTNDSDFVVSTDLSTVATSGSYNDLSNKPNFLDLFYPVGTYYWSSSYVNPEDLFGGTWEQVKDTFILAAGDTYYAGSTGGEATHTLTINEMPGHEHQTSKYGGTYAWGGANSSMFAGGGGYHTELSSLTTSSRGGDQPHNNMPPYLVAYCWHRTA